MNIIKELSEKSILKKDDSKKTKLLNKRYYCIEEIASGGLSIVYEGIDIYSEYFDIDSNLVIKIPNKELLTKSDIAAFVYSEYTFLRKLNLDTIVKVLDYGIDKKKNIPYLVLEKIHGKLLSETSIATMNIKDKNSIFKSLINTLSYIHSKNIIHADISPLNIIINDDFEPIIFDFGISQNINDNKDFSLEYNKVKAFNPKYCAPELLNDNTRPTISSDIFSLAAIMYEVYCNKPLFESSSKELFELPIEKRNLSEIPFFLRKWFKNALHIDVKKRKLLKNKIFFYKFNNY